MLAPRLAMGCAALADPQVGSSASFFGLQRVAQNDRAAKRQIRREPPSRL
jgi:hypothetical protein